MVEITDTGTGIPGHIAERIFEPFYTTKEVGRGTGIGLSISYGIIKEFGGEIRMESDGVSGTRFILYFPAREKENG